MFTLNSLAKAKYCMAAKIENRKIVMLNFYDSSMKDEILIEEFIISNAQNKTILSFEDSTVFSLERDYNIADQKENKKLIFNIPELSDNSNAFYNSNLIN